MSEQRQSVRVLTQENWRHSRRCRRSAGVYTTVWIEELPDGRYRTHFWSALNDWDTLEEALQYANTDTGGTMIVFGDVPGGAPSNVSYDRTRTRRLSTPPTSGLSTW